jgi:hypothetical protein
MPSFVHRSPRLTRLARSLSCFGPSARQQDDHRAYLAAGGLGGGVAVKRKSAGGYPACALTHCLTVLATASLIVLVSSHGAEAEIANIWAVDDGTKVKADTLDHPLEASNGIYDGTKIELFGSRNETIAFQVILEGGSSATAGVSAQLPRVGDIQNQSVSNDPDRYFVGRHIELFRQHYVEIQARSKGLVWEQSASGAEVPPDLDGPVPDALIPLNLIGGQLEVPANRNQGLWVDIYIPKTAQPGVHSGTLTITVDGSPCGLASCQIPLELTVLRATLPDAPAVDTMLFFSGDDNSTVIGRYFDDPGQTPRAERERIAERHFKLARRHQITLFMGNETDPDQPLEQRVKGNTFSAANGYYGPGVGLGQNVYSIQTYGGQLTAAQAQTWSSWFQANAPDAEYFLYVWDEPGEDSYGEINDIARQAQPVPAFVTAGYSPELSEIDIFAELAEYYSVQHATEGRAAGKRIWIYNGMRPFSGSFAIDDVAISPRVNPWIQYKHDIPRWFYWEATYYENFQGDEGQINVFQQARNFSNRWGDEVNGDGLLLYPGTDRIFPAEDRGHLGPLPSIRPQELAARHSGCSLFEDGQERGPRRRTRPGNGGAGSRSARRREGLRGGGILARRRRTMAELAQEARTPIRPTKMHRSSTTAPI